MLILFCIVIAILKGMSGQHFLKFHPNLASQLWVHTHIFRTNLFWPTKFSTNLLPNHFKFGKITKLPVLIWSKVQCFTVHGTIASISPLRQKQKSRFPINDGNSPTSKESAHSNLLLTKRHYSALEFIVLPLGENQTDTAVILLHLPKTPWNKLSC